MTDSRTGAGPRDRAHTRTAAAHLLLAEAATPRSRAAAGRTHPHP